MHCGCERVTGHHCPDVLCLPLQMLKFGIPMPAAQLKMIGEGLDPLVLECDPDKPLPKKFVPKEDEMERYTDGPALKDHETYGKFFKVPTALTPECQRIAERKKE